jgi:hypothetical protein
MSDTSLFADAVTCIKKYLPGPGDMPLQQTHDSLSIGAPDDSGFPVELRAGKRVLRVSHAYWHERFAKPAEAAKCFLFGLTPAAYLEVSIRGRTLYRWNLFTYADDEWASIGYVNLVFVPFLRRRQVFRFQNSWLTIEALKPWIGEQFADMPRADLGANQTLNRNAAGAASCERKR